MAKRLRVAQVLTPHVKRIPLNWEKLLESERESWKKEAISCEDDKSSSQIRMYEHEATKSRSFVPCPHCGFETAVFLRLVDGQAQMVKPDRFRDRAADRLKAETFSEDDVASGQRDDALRRLYGER